MRYVFHPDALAEYAEAVQYYAQQLTEVAQAFINAVEDAVYRHLFCLTSPNRIDQTVISIIQSDFPHKPLPPSGRINKILKAPSFR